jgi:hypothetical protein
VIRKPFFLLALLALALPMTAISAGHVGEGTLSVENGRGKVTLQGRGGVIGRLERGTVRIFDLSPADANQPVVSGADKPIRLVGQNGIQYAGSGLRFRLNGGGFRIVVDGRGIDLSVVGKGSGSIKGQTAEPGVYSLDGADCRQDASTCTPLPETLRRFQLGQQPERGGEKNLVRSASAPE